MRFISKRLIDWGIAPKKSKTIGHLHNTKANGIIDIEKALVLQHQRPHNQLTVGNTCLFIETSRTTYHRGGLFLCISGIHDMYN